MGRGGGVGARGNWGDYQRRDPSPPPGLLGVITVRTVVEVLVLPSLRGDPSTVVTVKDPDESCEGGELGTTGNQGNVHRMSH